MALKKVNIEWGAAFENTLELNDLQVYASATVGMFASPEIDVQLGDTSFDTPYVNRTRARERVFSVLTHIQATPLWGDDFTESLNAIKRACLQVDEDGQTMPVRVVVERTGIGDVYLEATCEGIQEVPEYPGRFQILFKSPDPYFTRHGPYISNEGNTGPSTLDYPDIPIPVYPGTAPSEPTLTLTVGGNGGVYRYYRDIAVTNNSDTPLVYYPICIDLGDISALVGTKFHEVNPGVDNRIRDIRVETLGGARKVIFVRDWANAHTAVKVWTVIYSLQPGETKTLRVLYGNALAPASELDETADAAIRPMFNMYNSTNDMWQYVDFLPSYTKPQTRCMQWVPYQSGSRNMGWIAHPHPHFDLNSLDNVPCGGTRVVHYGPALGYNGVQLHLPVSPSQVFFTYRLSTNAKTPFVLRSNRQDGRWVDDWSRPDAANPMDKTVLTTLASSATGGNSTVAVTSLTRSGAAFAVNDYIFINRNDGSVHRGQITSINTGLLQITFTPALSGSGTVASAGNAVQQGYSNNHTQTYTSSDGPRILVFALRGDLPQYTSGDWYYGAAEFCEITFDPATRPSVTTWGSATEVDVTLTGFQMKGRFGNATLSEYIGINTIVPSVLDKIVVDCAERTCTYYHWNGSSYDAGEDRYEGLVFDAIRRYWVHVSPTGQAQMVRFLADNQSQFTNLDVRIDIPVRYA